MGFFQESELLVSQAPIGRVPQCGKCGLLNSCKSPKMPISGEGKRKILIIGEAPGENEDNQNKQFVGSTGQILERTLRKFDIDMRRDCWLTNSLICRPPDNKEPSSTQVESCRPNLVNAIEKIKPHIIIPLGTSAVKSLIGWLWKSSPGGDDRWQGWNIPCQQLNAWICPTWHPSFIAQTENESIGTVAKVLWQNDFRNIAKLRGRPWDIVPDDQKQIRIVIDHQEAAKEIRAMIKRGGTAAFDLETNCLKPDWEDAEIISCSICSNGEKTIAYPWVGEAITATREFVRSKIKKIASNLKFEDRWIRRKLRTKVRNWWFDTMIGGHVQDNRRGVTSIKFQSFIWLGSPPYNDHIAPLLQTRGDQKINNIVKGIELRQLLKYNGLDSVLEYFTAFKQRKVMGFDE